MNIEFKDQTPEVEKEESIIVAGKTIGGIKTYLQWRDDKKELNYHAWIKFEGPGMLCNALIQGHGTTKIEAIQNAMISGRREANAVLDSISALESKIL